MTATAKNAEITVNGVNVTEVIDLVSAIEASPELAQSQYRLTNRWIDRGHSQSRITEFFSGGKIHNHLQEFVLDADVPAPLAGTDFAATPGEHLLNALAACITTTVVYYAALHGIEIRSLQASVEGDLDLRGFLSLSDNVRSGFEDVRLNLVIDADEEDLEKLESFIPISPMLDTVRRGTQVEIVVERQTRDS